jgi:CRP/FNR family cyclic AMP-dependent transcriptional regulator
MQITPGLIASFLNKIELFSGFNPDEIDAFVPHMQVVRMDGGQVIFKEGANGDAWYLILDGEVSVTKHMPSGPAHVLAHLESGDGFGEMALIDGAPRMASLHTLEDTILVRLSRDTFLELMRAANMPAIKLLWAMSSQLCGRQRDLTYVLSDLVEIPNQEIIKDTEVLTKLLRTNMTWN